MSEVSNGGREQVEDLNPNQVLEKLNKTVSRVIFQ